VHFVWDDAKARANLAKHGVDFADVGPVFSDPFRIELFDDRQDYGEERMLTIGSAANGRVLFVVTTSRTEGVMRIISARRATRREREAYRGG